MKSFSLLNVSFPIYIYRGNYFFENSVHKKRRLILIIEINTKVDIFSRSHQHNPVLSIPLRKPKNAATIEIAKSQYNLLNEYPGFSLKGTVLCHVF
jgi:hypothetical protein